MVVEEHEVRIDVDDSVDGDRLAKVRGVLDVFSSPALAARALANLPQQTREFVIDLCDVSFVDSAGVSALVRLQQEARTRAVEVRGAPRQGAAHDERDRRRRVAPRAVG